MDQKAVSMTRASPSANEDTIRKKEEKRKAADIAEQTVTLTCSQMAAADYRFLVRKEMSEPGQNPRSLKSQSYP